MMTTVITGVAHITMIVAVIMMAAIVTAIVTTSTAQNICDSA